MLHFRIEDLLADDSLTYVDQRPPVYRDTADYRAAIDRLTSAVLKAYSRYYSDARTGEAIAGVPVADTSHTELGLPVSQAFGALMALRAARRRNEHSGNDRV